MLGLYSGRTVLRTVAVCLLVAGGISTAPHQVAAKGGLSLGIVTMSASDEDTQNMVYATTAYAKTKGYAVQTIDSNGSLTQGNIAITDLVQKGVTAVLITTFSSKGLTQGLTAAKSAGIPVLTLGGGMAPGISMNTDDGTPDPVVAMLLKDNGGKGRVLNLTWHPGLPCFERATYLEQTVKQYPGIQLTSHEIRIPGAAETSKSFTLSWLAANPASSAQNFAIYNCYDDNALGAIAALKQTGRTGVKVYSFNATAPALQAVQAGWMTATLWHDLQGTGRKLVDAIPAITAKGSKWVPVTIPEVYVLVSKHNVASFIKAHPEIK